MEKFVIVGFQSVFVLYVRPIKPIPGGYHVARGDICDEKTSFNPFLSGT